YRSARYACKTSGGRLRLYFFDRAALVVAAVGTRLVRQLRFMAVRAFRTGRLRQVIVRPAGARPALRMSSLWIWHRTAPLFNSLEIFAFAVSLDRCFTPQKHTKPQNSTKNSALLLFLEPVLLQSRQGSETRIHTMGFAAAFLMIQVRAA